MKCCWCCVFFGVSIVVFVVVLFALAAVAALLSSSSSTLLLSSWRSQVNPKPHTRKCAITFSTLINPLQPQPTGHPPTPPSSTSCLQLYPFHPPRKNPIFDTSTRSVAYLWQLFLFLTSFPMPALRAILHFNPSCHNINCTFFITLPAATPNITHPFLFFQPFCRQVASNLRPWPIGGWSLHFFYIYIATNINNHHKSRDKISMLTVRAWSLVICLSLLSPPRCEGSLCVLLHHAIHLYIFMCNASSYTTHSFTRLTQTIQSGARLASITHDGHCTPLPSVP